MTDDAAQEPLAVLSSGEMSIEDALGMAVRAHQAGILEMAETIYQRILAIAPTHCEALQFLGRLRYQRGDAGEALRLLNQVVKLYPDHAGAHNNRGNILNALGHRAEALAAYQNAARLDVGHVEAYCNTGALLAAEGRLREAINLYYQAIKHNPQHVDTFYHLGQALEHLGRDMMRRRLIFTRSPPTIVMALRTRRWLKLYTGYSGMMRRSVRSVSRCTAWGATSGEW